MAGPSGWEEGTLDAFHYPDLMARPAHVLAFVTAYDFVKQLEALQWRTPFQAICDVWRAVASIFKIDPHQLIPKPCTWTRTTRICRPFGQ